MRPLDYLILAAIVVLLFFAIRYAVRHSKEDCDGNCSSCPYSHKCDQKKKR